MNLKLYSDISILHRYFDQTKNLLIDIYVYIFIPRVYPLTTCILHHLYVSIEIYGVYIYIPSGLLVRRRLKRLMSVRAVCLGECGGCSNEN